MPPAPRRAPPSTRPTMWSGWVATSPSSIIRCQNAVNRATPASVSRQTVTSLPSAEVRNGRPPASQTMALKKLASPASAVMYTPISLSFLAAS